jgi:hypothetical protein
MGPLLGLAARAFADIAGRSETASYLGRRCNLWHMLGVRATVTWWWQLMADVIGAVHTHLAAREELDLKVLTSDHPTLKPF